jgi:8-amino-7-oxononanoate synthase
LGTAAFRIVKAFEQEMALRLESQRKEGLYRELRRVDSAQSAHIRSGERSLLNFASNDYLGLANHPLLKAAAIEAVERYGAGAGASRLICGSLTPHHELDAVLAQFKGVEAALSFSSGYASALGAICALVGKNDILILDKLVHASIVDAARLSGAKLRVFAHNDLDSLEAILKWSQNHSRDKSTGDAKPNALVVTESVFSMDGDHAPLREMVELKDKYGAWLMVDEAHATGLYGKGRRGLAEELGVGDQIEVQVGTLGKALGAAGGYICGSQFLIDVLVNRARSFIFSTAPVPAAAAAAAAGIRLASSDEGEVRRQTLWQRVSELPASLRGAAACHSAIIPLILGDETRAVETASRLRERGIFIPAVRYPAVGRGQARLRLTLSAAHSAQDIAQLLSVLEQLGLWSGPEGPNA